MSQRVAIVLDNLGTGKDGPDEERDEILKELRNLGLEPKLVHYGHDPLALPETQIDLLVVDYGALWQQNMGDWTRGLLRWADERPNSMVLIWSSFTADMFVDELKEQFESAGGSHGESAPPGQVDSDGKWVPPWPHNVRAWYPGGKWNASWEAPDSGLPGDDDWGRWYHQSKETLRTFLGVEAPVRDAADWEWPKTDDEEASDGKPDVVSQEVVATDDEKDEGLVGLTVDHPRLGKVLASELTMEGTAARAIREAGVLPTDPIPRPHTLAAHLGPDGKWLSDSGPHSYHLDPIRTLNVSIPIREVENSGPAGFRFEWGEGETDDGVPVKATSGAGAGSTWATIAFGEGKDQREYMFRITDVIDLLWKAIKEAEGVPA